MTDEAKLSAAGFRQDGQVWKRGRIAVTRDGFGWMIWDTSGEVLWNDESLPEKMPA